MVSGAACEKIAKNSMSLSSEVKLRYPNEGT